MKATIHILINAVNFSSYTINSYIRGFLSLIISFSFLTNGIANERPLEKDPGVKTALKSKISMNRDQHMHDSYLMVMHQQVEKGDQSITYSFYMDQLTDLYKSNQLNADLQINHRFFLNNFHQDQPATLTAADESINKAFLLEHAE